MLISTPKQNRSPVKIKLVASKSESNRALIIRALSSKPIHLSNLSHARDTQTMLHLLSEDPYTIDVLDAGTTMRFLTAYYATKNKAKILTGSKRMQERPIEILVQALQTLGAAIQYLETWGYPPLKLTSFKQIQSELDLKADVSSQYISALLMVAPTLPHGLKLNLIGQIASEPYLQMTLALMNHFGIHSKRSANVIEIPPQNYQANDYTIESDWSGASYWYSIVALAQQSDLKVKLYGLRKHSLQGDRVVANLMVNLGVNTEFLADGVVLSKSKPALKFTYDFRNCPDLAQTVAVVCAAKGIEAVLTGLHSLPIKETDRLAALKTELSRFGAPVKIEAGTTLKIAAASLTFNNQCVQTYKDHRMAMAFAPLAMFAPIRIADPAVVKKSYPSFWDDLEQVLTIDRAST